jgi:UDP-N-acetyl-D-mannosaminuronate dehydrogenase
LNVARESKVVGGMTPACTEMGVRFYSQVLKEVAARVVDAGGGDW